MGQFAHGNYIIPCALKYLRKLALGTEKNERKCYEGVRESVLKGYMLSSGFSFTGRLAKHAS